MANKMETIDQLIKQGYVSVMQDGRLLVPKDVMHALLPRFKGRMMQDLNKLNMLSIDENVNKKRPREDREEDDKEAADMLMSLAAPPQKVLKEDQTSVTEEESDWKKKWFKTAARKQLLEETICRQRMRRTTAIEKLRKERLAAVCRGPAGEKALCSSLFEEISLWQKDDANLKNFIVNLQRSKATPADVQHMLDMATACIGSAPVTEQVIKLTHL